MSADIHARSGSPRPLPLSGWTAGTILVGAALGGLAAIDETVAFAVALAIATAFALLSRPRLILPLLVGSIFVEATMVGGIPISRLLAPVALIVLIAVASRDRLEVRAGAPLVLAGAYALWALTSGLWTIDMGLTADYFGSLAIALVYTIAIAALMRSDRDLHRVGLTFSFAAFALGLFAITDFLFGIGWTLEGGRAAGGAGDPNYFAAYQVIALPVTLAMAAHVRQGALRAALYAAAAVIVLSIFFSVSRGGLLTLAVVATLAFMLPARTLFRSPTQKLAILCVVLVGLGFAVQSAADEIAPRFRTIVERDNTGSGRVGLWMAGWTGIKERPLAGHGYGAFPAASNDLILRTAGIDLRHYELRPRGHEAHNMYVSTTADLGLPGLALLLGILATTGHSLRRTAARASRESKVFVARIANALFLSLVGIALAGLFLSAETSRALWIVVGLSLALPKLVDERTDELSSL